MINWQPVNSTNLDSNAFRYKRIAAGNKDGYIRSFAQAAAAWGQPVLLRMAHEMNADWFPWGVWVGDNTPARFIAAWRHVHTLFQEEGATNVKFVWAPYRRCCGSTSFKAVWPGGRYVHYMSFSAFNWSTSALPWVSMAKLYEQPLKDLAAISTKKPIIVSETASSPNGGDKAKWIKAGHQKIYDLYPKVVGIVYFNFRVDGHPNWKLTKPAAALEAYAWLAADPRFQRRFVP
jgi:beta-mannanase